MRKQYERPRTSRTLKSSHLHGKEVEFLYSTGVENRYCAADQFLNPELSFLNHGQMFVMLFYVVCPGIRTNYSRLRTIWRNPHFFRAFAGNNPAKILRLEIQGLPNPALLAARILAEQNCPVFSAASNPLWTI